MAERKVTIIHQGQERQGVEVPIDHFDERQSTYQLADGTVLTMRNVVVGVVRLDDEHNEQGEPVYVLKSQNIVSASVPDKLRRKMR